MLSSSGTADGDTFSFEGDYRYTIISLTTQNDSLLVNDTYNSGNSSAVVPTFFLLGGNDSAICYSNCNIFGGDGIDTYQINGSAKMTVYDFDVTSDIIDLRYTHPSIKHQINLAYTKSNSTTMVITLSSTQSIVLYPVPGDIYSFTILFDAPSCWIKCKNCTTEAQCDVCSDCGYCNTTNCNWCDATHYLQEGRCVS